jgi:hypothetical protein
MCKVSLLCVAPCSDGRRCPGAHIKGKGPRLGHLGAFFVTVGNSSRAGSASVKSKFNGAP